MITVKKISAYFNEVWKDISGFEGEYQVSNYGRVKSINYNHTGTSKILRCARDGNGYCVFSVYTPAKRRLYVHRIVAQVFIPNPQNLPVVNHKDEDTSNNFVYIKPDGSVDPLKSNLEWCTVKYNSTYLDTRKRALETKNKNGSYGSEKPVKQYDLKGNFVKEYKSLREAIRVNKNGNISRCVRGASKTASGYIWTY